MNLTGRYLINKRNYSEMVKARIRKPADGGIAYIEIQRRSLSIGIL